MALVEVVYDGPYSSVVVPSLGLTVQKGSPVKVEQDDAKALVRQSVWKVAKAPVETKETPAVSLGK